jgi:hypothetical protein
MPSASPRICLRPAAARAVGEKLRDHDAGVRAEPQWPHSSPSPRTPRRAAAAASRSRRTPARRRRRGAQGWACAAAAASARTAAAATRSASGHHLRDDSASARARAARRCARLPQCSAPGGEGARRRWRRWGRCGGHRCVCGHRWVDSSVDLCYLCTAWGQLALFDDAAHARSSLSTSRPLGFAPC